MHEKNKSHWQKHGTLTGIFWGIVLIIIGLVLLGERYDWFGIGVDLSFDRIWPVFIILGGIYIIIKNQSCRGS